MSDDNKFSGNDPSQSTGYSVIYPDRMKRVTEQRKKQANVEPADKILSRNEAAKFLHLSLTTIDRMLKKEDIPFYKIGSRILFLQSQLRIFLLDKQTLPESWKDTQFRQKLTRKTEELRLLELNKRRKELFDIWDEMDKAEAEGGEKKATSPLAGKLDIELRSILNEMDAIQAEQTLKIRERLGITEDKK